MKTKFGFIDPGAIMGIVVALVILGVGAFAVFITLNSLATNPYKLATGGDQDQANATYFAFTSARNNTTAISNNVFNIIGVVMIIGAIMSIVGLVYNYVR